MRPILVAPLLLTVLIANCLPAAQPGEGPSLTATPGLHPTEIAGGQYLFGTLQSDPAKAVQEHRAGVRVAELELGWDRYEPREGVFDAQYVRQAREQLQQLRAAGMDVVLGIGLQYPPTWVLAYPNSRYVNQDGATYESSFQGMNLVFNQTLRERAERFIARVDQDLGLQNFWAVRIGGGGFAEVLYPPARYGGQENSYWAYDVNAQGGAGRPSTIPPAPFAGWRPGQRTYDGRPFTAAQVQQWYDWYVGALADSVNWQIATYRHLGYMGYLQVVMAGVGTRPREYAAGVAGYLGGAEDRSHTMGRGAVWDKILDALVDRRGVVVYVSSMADGSGGNDACQPEDTAVRPDNPVVESWSAARWLSYNADRYGLPKNGENPGRAQARAYGPALLQDAAAQMQACGLQGLMWAHDADLYDPGSGISLADYAAVIARYRP